MLGLLISSLLQVLVFAAVPFGVYQVQRRLQRRRSGGRESSGASGGRRGFLASIGLFRPESRTMGYATLLVVAFATLMLLLLSVPGVREVASAPNTVPGRLRALGLSSNSVVLLGLYALVQTALSEEILFRGFLAKRLITRLGFHWGNLAQSVLFGAMHLLLFAGPTGQPFSLPRAAAVVAFTSLIGWGMGYLNERVGNGSIVPSWWTHGLTNIVAYSTLAFGGR